MQIFEFKIVIGFIYKSFQLTSMYLHIGHSRVKTRNAGKTSSRAINNKHLLRDRIPTVVPGFGY